MNTTLKILVVDDHDTGRSVVCQALKAAGIPIDVSEAWDYPTAIAIIQHKTFDCIFLDYQLLDNDGLTLIQKLRMAQVNVPLVVLMDEENEQLAVHLLKAGASGYLAKGQISSKSLEPFFKKTIPIYSIQGQVERSNKQRPENNQHLTHSNPDLNKQPSKTLHFPESSQLKSQFLATTSHELRTPMNAIIGFAQMLLLQRHGLLTQEQMEMVKCILNNSQNLLSLMTEVLDFAQIEAGCLKLKLEQFNLAQLVKLTTEEIRPLAAQKQLGLQVYIALQNPHIINDRLYLRKVLINLLSNAIKFTESGSITVEVWESEPQRLVIAVRDTGIGMSEGKLSHIFEPFRQLDQTIARQYSGTGLGLTIASSLVQMMQGTIRVASNVGEGSVFQVELPRQVSSWMDASGGEN